MSPSTMDKLREDNYFHWEYNMHMKLARKGLLPHIVNREHDAYSDRASAKWKDDDLRALGIIAGEVDVTYQVYIRGAVTAMQAWLEEQYNKNTLKNKILIMKKLHNFKMQAGTPFTEHVDQFQQLIVKSAALGDQLDETQQIVLQLGSLTDEYRLIVSVLENTPNRSLRDIISRLSGVEVDGRSARSVGGGGRQGGR